MWDTIVRFRVPILLGAGSLFALCLSVFLFLKSTDTATPILFSSDIASESGRIFIDVEGAVVRPGVYELSSGSRVEDALTMAGGLTDDADLELVGRTVNRAQQLVDGGKLYIPGKTTTLLTPPSSAFVSVNSSPKEALDALPGIGPVTAQKIIDNRPYQAIEELVANKVVGQATFEKIKDQLSL